MLHHLDSGKATVYMVIIMPIQVKVILTFSTIIFTIVITMARPPKDPRLLMNVPLRIMLTEAQRELIGRAAGLYGGDIAAWARPILLRAAQAALEKKATGTLPTKRQ